MSSLSEVRQWRDDIDTSFGGVDIIINNAGIALIANADVQSNEAIARVMDVNFLGRRQRLNDVLALTASIN